MSDPLGPTILCPGGREACLHGNDAAWLSTRTITLASGRLSRGLFVGSPAPHWESPKNVRECDLARSTP